MIIGLLDYANDKVSTEEGWWGELLLLLKVSGNL